MNRLRNITIVIGVLAVVTTFTTLLFAYSIATEIAAITTITSYGLLCLIDIKRNNQSSGGIDNG